MRIVVALGGNALLRRGETMNEERLRANVRIAAAALAPLCTAGHEMAITHGNGPQIGILALQNEAGPKEGHCALDILGAETQGMIGYLLEQEMRNLLQGERPVATLLTQVEVDANDPAFVAPAKPIGLHYDEAEAHELQHKRGWTMVSDGAKWRRAVASPQPKEFPDMQAIEMLAASGMIVVCLGGGGVPVVRGGNGEWRGVEAVIDKDVSSSLLAQKMGADALLLLTDVDAVYEDWGDGAQKPLRSLAAAELKPGDFEAGTMRPKIAAAKAFAMSTGKPCAIGRLEDASALLAGTAGTIVLNAPRR